MSREKNLAKNTGVLAVGKLLPQLTAFVTLPILTQNLTKAEYGTYDLIATLIMLIIPIATLQIQSAAFRFLIDCRDDAAQCTSIITNIFIVTIPVSLLAAVIVQFFFMELSVLERALMSLYFVFDTIYLTIGQVARGLGKNKQYSVAAITLSVINMVCVILSVQMAEMGLLGVLIGLCIANAAASIYLSYAVSIRKYLKTSEVSKKEIGRLLAYSWPMVPNNMSNWVLKLSDRLLITFFLGIEANAVYAAANKIPNLLSVAQGIMVMAWQENASMAVNDEDASGYYTKMFDRIFCLMIGFTAALIGVTPVMFKILIRGDYGDAYVQMPILILAMFFYCMAAFQGGIYIAHKKTKSVGFTTMGAAAINLAVDFLLIYVCGITAGSVSTLVAYFSLFLFRMLDSRKFQPMKFNVKKQILMYALITVMLIVCFMQNFYLNILNFIIGMVMFVVINNEFLKIIWSKVLKTIKGGKKK